MSDNKNQIAKELAEKAAVIRKKKLRKKRKAEQQALDNEVTRKKAALDNGPDAKKSDTKGPVQQNTLPIEMDNDLSQKMNNTKNDKPITATIQNVPGSKSTFMRNLEMKNLEKMSKDFANDPKNNGVCNIIKDARGAFKGMEFIGPNKVTAALAFIKQFENKPNSGNLSLQTNSKKDAKALSDNTKKNGNIFVNEIKKVAAVFGIGGSKNEPEAKSKLAAELTKNLHKPRPQKDNSY